MAVMHMQSIQQPLDNARSVLHACREMLGTAQAQAQTMYHTATDAADSIASSSSVHSTQNHLQPRHSSGGGIEMSSSISSEHTSADRSHEKSL